MKSIPRLVVRFARAIVAAVGALGWLGVAQTGLVGKLFPAPETSALAQAPGTPYYPGVWRDWERRTLEQAGMTAARIDEAIAFARPNYAPQPRDANGQPVFVAGPPNEPYRDVVGPTKPRGEMNGLILRHGYIVAEWGDTERADMTYSVTKTYLSVI
jgi:hypothetical protein